ncbi:hypothetical protein E8E13_009929 [Curvularia kusanoi]|uniref:RING-type domain-containing protein n=1 Tax=Curvularia kusanoi TaxID=90978 RepID=A0A9P4TG46_CURKU|nr:hypothetical protein E8E13_009929 [Curvularia kusanoi]
MAASPGAIQALPPSTTTDVVIKQLPSQKTYLMYLELAKSKNSTAELCGICLESFTEAVSECCGLPDCKGKSAITSKPCEHLFHYCCISTWHNSIRPERNTCTTCRCELFIAYPLSVSQIDQLVNELTPGQRLVRSDMYWLITRARMLLMAIDIRALERPHFMRFVGYPYVEFCLDMRNELLQNGVVNPAFEQHRDTFVPIMVATSILIEMAYSPHHTRSPDFLSFVVWVSNLRDNFTNEDYVTLYMEFLRRGLFATSDYQARDIPNALILQHTEFEARVLEVSTKMAKMNKRSKLVKKLWHIANFSVNNVLARPYHCRSYPTLCSLLGRVIVGRSTHDVVFGGE